MNEFFETRTLSGPINIACKFEGQPTRYWVTTKEDVSAHIVAIVRKYIAANEILTLRQLHYQFVGHVPGYVNHDSAYSKLGDILDDLRYSGRVPWNAFEDRGRKPYIPYSVDGIADALQDTVDFYRLNRQEGQKVHVELWTEKDALSAIFKKSTERFHIRLVINKGYTSSTAAYEAYRRIVKVIEAGKKVLILYFGDHDPSGLDMVRDIRERLLFFICRGEVFKNNKAVQQWYERMGYNVYDICDRYEEGEKASAHFQKTFASGAECLDKHIDTFEALKIRSYLESNDLFEVRHIGLTKEQIKKFNLPENPTKMTDSRATGYIRQHGRRCWEVDALEIQELRSILDTNIISAIDGKLFNEVVAREAKEKKELQAIINKHKK